jgi:hypothetical protein
MVRLHSKDTGGTQKIVLFSAAPAVLVAGRVHTDTQD